ncbi:hypothetical protein AAHB53_07025 [Niallia circulans]
MTEPVKAQPTKAKRKNLDVTVEKISKITKNTRLCAGIFYDLNPVCKNWIFFVVETSNNYCLNRKK